MCSSVHLIKLALQKFCSVGEFFGDGFLVLLRFLISSPFLVSLLVVVCFKVLIAPFLSLSDFGKLYGHLDGHRLRFLDSYDFQASKTLNC